jgi:two-component system, NarL family, response regulator NreC
MLSPESPIRVLVANDYGITRAGLRALLNAEADMEVVGEAADGDEALRMAGLLRPDVAVLDLSMPGAGGIEVTRQLVATFPGVRALILTMHEDQAMLREALHAGAAGYITRRAMEAELLMAVRIVHRGDLYIHPSIAAALLRNTIAGEPARAASGAALTPRETEVLQLIALGYTNRQTAEALHISIRTVETHRAHLMAKLQLEGRAALVRYAREHGLLRDRNPIAN